MAIITNKTIDRIRPLLSNYQLSLAKDTYDIVNEALTNQNEENDQKLWKNLTEESEKGSAVCKLLLAEVYRFGDFRGSKIRKKENKTIVKLYQEATSANLPEAQSYLALAYQKGRLGLKKNDKKTWGCPR